MQNKHRQHGQTTYFLVGEGFVSEEAPPRPRAAIAAARAIAATSATPPPPPEAPDPERAFRFNRLFPQLSPFRPSRQALEELGETMGELQPVGIADSLIPSGFTYFGQFVDHDITFDKTEGLPTADLDPAEIIQGRSPSLDLDSIYGRGPAEEPELYDPAGNGLLKLGITTASPAGLDPAQATLTLPNDLPRHTEGPPFLAIIGDPRNDENLAVAQTHLAVLKFHNKVHAHLASQTGAPTGDALFQQARETVTRHYQWILLHDFLPRVAQQSAIDAVLANGRKYYQLDPTAEPAMPVEFSVGAYRMGHSMIRDSYEWNKVFRTGGPLGGTTGTLRLLFRFTGSGQGASPTLPTNWIVDWNLMYDFTEGTASSPDPKVNRTKQLDTTLASGLEALPEFGGVGLAAMLAVRNLIRGSILGLPSGQDLAKHIGAPVMSPAEILNGLPPEQATVVTRHGFENTTPLWFYLLKEARHFENGEKLGPVGSILLAEVFHGLIQGSRTTILDSCGKLAWTPTLPGAVACNFKMTDLLNFLGAAELNPLG